MTICDFQEPIAFYDILWQGMKLLLSGLVNVVLYLRIVGKPYYDIIFIPHTALGLVPNSAIGFAPRRWYCGIQSPWVPLHHTKFSHQKKKLPYFYCFYSKRKTDTKMCFHQLSSFYFVYFCAKMSEVVKRDLDLSSTDTEILLIQPSV